MKHRNIHFWESINDDWVHLTLKPGQQLSWYRYRDTDEGFHADSITWNHDGDLIVQEHDTYARDCDGRLDKHYVYSFDPNYVEMDACVTFNRNGVPVPIPGMFHPVWEEGAHCIIDHEAQKVGY